MNKKQYKPKRDLKQVVIELAIILANTNPGYEFLIKDILDDMARWGKSESELKEK